MAEVVNDSDDPVTVEWCVTSDHYDAEGSHSGSGCSLKSHTVAPGAVLSYDEDPPNAPHIASVVTAAGLTSGV